MAATFSKKKLNQAMYRLPVPVREHSKRVKLFAAFLVERLRSEDDFIEGNLNGTRIAEAAYYHDIGKLAVPKDTIYLRHCKTVAKRSSYESHVEQGIELAQTESGVFFAECTARSFASYVYSAIAEHHERMDGGGFPYGKKGEEISLVGRITAIADAFDNLLFVGSSGKIDFAAAVNELRSLSGDVLDARLVSLFLSDEEALRGFIDFIDEKLTSRRKRDKYGILVWYEPVMDIRENKLSAFLTQLYINDPYYGIVKQDVFMPAAVRTNRVVTLEKIGLRKICAMVKKLNRRKIEVPKIFYSFSMKQFERKTFIKELSKTLSSFGVPASQFCFGVREGEAAFSETDVAEALSSLRSLGAAAVVFDFGENSTLLPTLDTLGVNKVVFTSGYGEKIVSNPNAYSVVSGIVQIAQNLHIDVVFTGISTREVEANALRMLVKYGEGALYGGELTEEKLARFISEAEGQ